MLRASEWQQTQLRIIMLSSIIHCYQFDAYAAFGAAAWNPVKRTVSTLAITPLLRRRSSGRVSGRCGLCRHLRRRSAGDPNAGCSPSKQCCVVQAYVSSIYPHQCLSRVAWLPQLCLPVRHRLSAIDFHPSSNCQLPAPRSSRGRQKRKSR
jgi:hypothetical protein